MSTEEKEAALLEELIDGKRDAVGYLLSQCQSPIERLFMVAMLLKFPSSEIYRSLADGTFFFGSWRFYGRLQEQVGRYRIDVSLRSAVTTKFKVAIELDGHAFHERTKQQAAHDRRRDRALTAAGWTVLRFTGSEVFADAEGCASEVRKIVLQLQRTHADPMYWTEEE